MKKARWLITGAILALLLLGFALPILAADPAVSITVSKWAQAPLAPTNFEIEQTALHSINVTWTKGTAANITIVRYDTDGYPFSIFDGSSAYSGNGTYVEMSDLNLSDNTYYFRAWSQNEYGTSANYAQASIGSGTEDDDDDGAVAFLTFSLDGGFGLLEMMLVIAIMGFAFWKKSWIRTLLSIVIIIWGVFAMQYDIKVAAPLLAIGTVLFFMGVMNLIEHYRESREEA